jgi:hypothetical protein
MARERGDGWHTDLHEQNPTLLLRGLEYWHVPSIGEGDDVVQVECEFLS